MFTKFCGETHESQLSSSHVVAHQASDLQNGNYKKLQR